MNVFLRKFELIGFVVFGLAVAGAGTGWVTQRSTTSAVQAALPVEPPSDAEEDQDKPATPAPRPEDKPKKPDPITGTDALAKALSDPLDFPGSDGPDPNLTLEDFLYMLTDITNVRFEINEAAFGFEAEGANVRQYRIAQERGLPKLTGSSLRHVLRVILSRIRMTSGVTYVIRKDYVEITTSFFAHGQVGACEALGRVTDLTDFPTPLVYKNFRDKNLSEIIEELADSTEASINLDPRIGEKETKETVYTLRLMNLSLDVALTVVAEVANLRVVRINNSFYLTTPEKAEAMKQAGRSITISPSTTEALNQPAPIAP